VVLPGRFNRRRLSPYWGGRWDLNSRHSEPQSGCRHSSHWESTTYFGGIAVIRPFRRVFQCPVGCTPDRYFPFAYASRNQGSPPQELSRSDALLNSIHKPQVAPFVFHSTATGTQIIPSDRLPLDDGREQAARNTRFLTKLLLDKFSVSHPSVIVGGVRIEFPWDYPHTEPTAFDRNERFKKLPNQEQSDVLKSRISV
jgi:hypothetical protein